MLSDYPQLYDGLQRLHLDKAQQIVYLPKIDKFKFTYRPAKGTLLGRPAVRGKKSLDRIDPRLYPTLKELAFQNVVEGQRPGALMATVDLWTNNGALSLFEPVHERWHRWYDVVSSENGIYLYGDVFFQSVLADGVIVLLPDQYLWEPHMLQELEIQHPGFNHAFNIGIGVGMTGQELAQWCHAEVHKQRIAPGISSKETVALPAELAP